MKFIQPIQKRSILQRLIRIPGMWRKQWNYFENVPIKDKIIFLLRSAWIVLKNH